MTKVEPSHRWLQYFPSILWFLMCGFMVVLWSHEVWLVKTQPDEYSRLWGGEGPVAGVSHYASETMYLLHLAVLILWFLAGMLLSLGQGTFRRPRLLFGHAVLSSLWVGYNVLWEPR